MHMCGAVLTLISRKKEQKHLSVFAAQFNSSTNYSPWKDWAVEQRLLNIIAYMKIGSVAGLLCCIVAAGWTWQAGNWLYSVCAESIWTKTSGDPGLHHWSCAPCVGVVAPYTIPRFYCTVKHRSKSCVDQVCCYYCMRPESTPHSKDLMQALIHI